MADDPDVPQAFLSYARTDDDYLSGGITWLREELQRAMKATSGEPFEIFQDTDGIAFGEHWPSRIIEALTAARFLIPILTPSYFTSEACREEAEFFLNHEKRHKRRDLILPIYLIEADVLEDSAERAGDYLARQFYERQYGDWRDAAFELWNAPRIKHRVMELAKQVKLAAKRVSGDTPPIVPAQGPGVRFGLNREGKVDRAPDEPTEVTNDDPRLCSLQTGLKEACDRFLGSFEGSAGQNAYGRLIDSVRAYQYAIEGSLTELQYTDVYRHGLTLQNHVLARSRDVAREDTLPSLEDDQEAAIHDLITLHSAFILSTKEGEALQARVNQAQVSADERAKLWSPALSEAAIASDHTTNRAKALLAEVNQASDENASSDPQALLALATNRNFLTATGEAAIGKDFSDIGEYAANKAGQAAGRFLLKNEKLVKQLAQSSAYGLAWLSPFLTWLRGRPATKPTVQPVPKDAPAIVTNDLWTPGRVFRDIDEPWCPEMVVIPAGNFLMGSPEDEPGRRDNEGPQHLMIIEKPFALGRYPITFEEFDFFCAETGQEKPEDEGMGRGKRPVINIFWQDAAAYCNWLSELTRRDYYLPTEAEWEYACRAGTITAYVFGDQINMGDANFGNHIGKTLEVGAYAANAFGLYDMHGSVWEWCADHFWDSYAAPLANNRPLLLTDITERVTRGGSWVDVATSARAASRDKRRPDSRTFRVGFRCAGVLD